MKRRDFVKLGSMLAAGAGTAYSMPVNHPQNHKLDKLNQSVNFIYDGLAFSPIQYADLLMKLADEGELDSLMDAAAYAEQIAAEE